MKKIGGVKRIVYSTDTGIESKKFKEFTTAHVSKGNRCNEKTLGFVRG